ncbi:MAG: PAS domain-containing sensor histidine kinase [Deltaproteobacteria bacterium]|nr:PAS domain-containing sensor histidine kinase [Deltaproteobacteria bacterium]
MPPEIGLESDVALPDVVRQLLDGLADAAVVLRRDRTVVYWNDAYLHYSGKRRRALKRAADEGRPCFEIFGLDICHKDCALEATAHLGRAVRMDEIGAVRGDGEHLTLIVTATPLGHGLFLETYRDVTADARIQRNYKLLLEREREAKEDLERVVGVRTEELRTANADLKAAQAMLVHQEKMSSLGRLVAGIAHELNNPINFVYGNIDFVEEYFQNVFSLVKRYEELLPDDPETKAKVNAFKDEIEYDYLMRDATKLLASIRYGAERTASIVRDLKTFSRAGAGQMAEADLVSGIHATLNLLHSVIKDRIEVELDIEPLKPVMCNVGHINQVFMNILQNAVDAIDGPGKIVIRTRNMKDGVQIVFKDSGSGIPYGNISKLFEPFYTTKGVGKGTGLGLAICDGIVRSHGGRIGVESRPGSGAVFVLELPYMPPDMNAARGSGENA